MIGRDKDNESTNVSADNDRERGEKSPKLDTEKELNSETEHGQSRDKSDVPSTSLHDDGSVSSETGEIVDQPGPSGTVQHSDSMESE